MVARHIMPELPEVETIRRDLKRYVLGKKIKQVTATHPKVVGGNIAAFCRALRGQHFTQIDRVGKLLIFSLAPGQFLLVHLKMTGQLIYQAGPLVIAGGHSQTDYPGVQPGPHTRVIITFADNSKLFFHDMRLFGFMKMVDEAGRNKAVSAFGIEPLTEHFTEEKFAAVFRGRKTSTKTVLLNQALIAGIGNIYADEICFAAGIRPSRRAARLRKADLAALYTATTQVIRRAIAERGTTFNNYVDGAGNKGNFLKFLAVYGRGGQPCRTCERPLIKKRIAGRGTVYCVYCQK